MSTVAHSQLPRARQDLCFRDQRWSGGRYWTVKDPVRLRYFQLRDEEHFVLQLLDGQHSLSEIVARFEARFAPRRLRVAELTSFVQMLHREGLTVASAYGQGEHLLTRRAEHHRRQWLGALSNVLAIKLPGVNPDRWLTQLVATTSWLFSPMLWLSCLLLIVAAGLLVTLDLPALMARVPRLHELLGPANLLTMFIALAVVKTLHELGHAIACKYFGGQCPQLGVMLLFFTPALYCDVSDAWMFPSRWQRMLVSAAGMLVELVLGSTALLLWACTQPGWLNTLLFNVFLVCTVSTLLMNANPLLRYDGYFIFSDWLGIPNLREQTQGALRRWGARFTLGIELPPPPVLVPASLPLLLTYGVLSLLYRWLMIGAALWLLSAALEPHGWAVLAQAIAVPVLASQVVGPLTAAGRVLSDPLQRQRIQWRRFGVTCLVVLLLGGLLLATPWPRRVSAPLVLQAADAQPIYVTTPGTLEQVAASGAPVDAGQEIGRLRNLELAREVAALAERVAQQRLRIEQWEIRRHDDPALGEALPVAKQTLHDLQQQLVQKQRQQAELILLAPRAGTLLPPPSRPANTEPDELQELAGTPLAAENRGCFLETGTLIGSIGSPHEIEALAIVQEGELPLLAVGQTARLALGAAPGQILTGKVASIAPLRARDLPDALWSTGAFPLEKQASGQRRLQSNYFQVIIALDPHNVALLPGGIGEAKIRVAPETLAWRAYRALRGVLRWPF